MTPKARESFGSPVRFGSRRDLVFSFFPSFGAFLGALGVFARYDLSSLARSSSVAQVAKIAKKSHFSFLLFLALFPFYAALCLLAFLAPLREMSFLAVRHPNEDVWQLLDCCLSTLRVVAEIRTDSRVCEDSDVLMRHQPRCLATSASLLESGNGVSRRGAEPRREDLESRGNSVRSSTDVRNPSWCVSNHSATNHRDH